MIRNIYNVASKAWMDNPNKLKLNNKLVKWTTRSRELKDTECNTQKKKDKETNNDLQNIIQKTKDWEARTRYKTGDKVRFIR